MFEQRERKVHQIHLLTVNFKVWGVAHVLFAITCSVFFKVRFYCHTSTKEARPSRILVRNLLIEGNCRNESVEMLKMFPLQLQAMINQYTACGFFAPNLRIFASVVSVIASYIIIVVQIK